MLGVRPCIDEPVPLARYGKALPVALRLFGSGAATVARTNFYVRLGSRPAEARQWRGLRWEEAESGEKVLRSCSAEWEWVVWEWGWVVWTSPEAGRFGPNTPAALVFGS